MFTQEGKVHKPFLIYPFTLTSPFHLSYLITGGDVFFILMANNFESKMDIKVHLTQIEKPVSKSFNKLTMKSGMQKDSEIPKWKKPWSKNKN